MSTQRWTIFKRTGVRDDAIVGPDTGSPGVGTEVVALDDLFSNVMCDRILDELVVQAGDERGYTSDKVPFARWDMRAALRRALEA